MFCLTSIPSQMGYGELIKRANKPLVISMVIWFVITFVWTPLWLGYIDRILGQGFENSQAQWWVALGHFLETNLAEVCLPLCFYLFVVKPYVQLPIINTRYSTRYRWLALTLIIIGTYTLFVPQLTYEYDVAPHLITGATFIGVGLCEEWSFRGVFTRVFKERFGIVWATVIVSLLFTLSHWAEIMLVNGQQIFSIGWLLPIAYDMLFAIVFSVIAWRSGSIAWAAFLHCMLDWKPWLFGRQHWMTNIDIPFVGNTVVIFAIGIVGAEVIRAFTKERVHDTQFSKGYTEFQ